MKHIKLFEAYIVNDKVKDLINWRMIDDIKDIALEYIDDGFKLCIGIYIIYNKNFYRFYIRYDHSEDSIVEDKTIDMRQDSTKDRIDYNVYLIKRGYVFNMKELAERIKEAYPNENIGF